MASIQGGSDTVGVANVDPNFNIQANLPGYTSGGVARGGTDTNAGAAAIFSEVDAGTITATRSTISPETDDDSRLRVAIDQMMDQEIFNYTSQNTGKHTFTFTTLAATIAAAGITTNSSSVTTTTIGLTFGTFAQFPVGGTQTIVCETSVAFSAQPNANTIIDFGLFQRGATTAFAPLDGMYFRMNSAGMFGIINSAGVETPTAVFPLALGTGTFAYTNNRTYRFLIQSNNVRTTFWIDNVLMGSIPTPVGATFPCKSLALPWSFRHAIVGGAAGAVTQAVFSDYKVYIRGPIFAESLGTVQNRVLGSYQGLSGGTMGSLSVYANSTNSTAAVPSNTALTANLPAGLGGHAWETFTLAVNTDGILMSYQVPAGSSTVQGRRLRVRGVKLSSFVQTVLAGGPLARIFCLNYGHTAAALNTAESASMASATTKARRVVLLPELTQVVTAAQAVSTIVSQPGGAYSEFDEPIYVNPGEFVSVSVKHIGTVGTAGTIATAIQLVYSWE